MTRRLKFLNTQTEHLSGHFSLCSPLKMTTQMKIPYFQSCLWNLRRKRKNYCCDNSWTGRSVISTQIPYSECRMMCIIVNFSICQTSLSLYPDTHTSGVLFLGWFAHICSMHSLPFPLPEKILLELLSRKIWPNLILSGAPTFKVLLHSPLRCFWISRWSLASTVTFAFAPCLSNRGISSRSILLLYLLPPPPLLLPPPSLRSLSCWPPIELTVPPAKSEKAP